MGRLAFSHPVHHELILHLFPMTGFLKKLISWYQANARDLPFRHTKDPYLIWLSEVIMQQTRIDQGVPYYDKFIKVFPTVLDLANAREDEVLKQWQGLGYYSRARNLHSTANEVVEKYAGRFPETYDGLRSLKGIGDYTAAAIASVCFGLPHPVMDGNVIRFITRHFGITASVDLTAAKKEIIKVLTSLMDGIQRSRNLWDPGLFNQAMIEFGAICCIPRNPGCNRCIFKTSCYARRNGMVGELPLKKQQKPLKPRYFNYLVIRVGWGGGLYFNKRSENDIWKGLYEFPLIETPGSATLTTLMNSADWKKYFAFVQFSVLGQTKAISHLLSHQKIIATFFSIKIEKPYKQFGSLIPPEKMHELPVPGLIERYFKDMK